MSGDLLYEIVRTWATEVDDEEDENYGDTVERTERTRLTSSAGKLAYTVGDGPCVPCGTTDADAAISDNPLLNEVRPNQITTITASPDIVQFLPLALVPTGVWADYDEYAWSEEMSAHLVESFNTAMPHDVYRVLYVNEKRWRMWHTNASYSMLPGEEDVVTLETEWAYASIHEDAEMNSGHSVNTLGLVTRSVVLEINSPDTDGVFPEEGSVSLSLRRWSHSAASAAEILANWVMSSPVSYFFYSGSGLQADPKNFVQLFAMATVHEEHAVSLSAEELVEASGFELDYYSRGPNISTVFGLGLSVDAEVVTTAAEIIGRANSEYFAMIVASRDPSSAEGVARDERMRQLRGRDEDDS